jgi:hypothetical protein
MQVDWLTHSLAAAPAAQYSSYRDNTRTENLHKAPLARPRAMRALDPQARARPSSVRATTSARLWPAAAGPARARGCGGRAPLAPTAATPSSAARPASGLPAPGAEASSTGRREALLALVVGAGAAAQALAPGQAAAFACPGVRGGGGRGWGNTGPRSHGVAMTRADLCFVLCCAALCCAVL